LALRDAPNGLVSTAYAATLRPTVSTAVSGAAAAAATLLPADAAAGSTNTVMVSALGPRIQKSTAS